jgi:hypothetical protein
MVTAARQPTGDDATSPLYGDDDNEYNERQRVRGDGHDEREGYDDGYEWYEECEEYEEWVRRTTKSQDMSNDVSWAIGMLFFAFI